MTRILQTLSSIELTRNLINLNLIYGRHSQITLSELRHVLSHWGDKLSEKEMDTLLMGVDVVDGKVKEADLLKNLERSTLRSK